MDKKKYIKIALIFICIISITLIGTYALKLWSSTDNTELTFRIGEYQTDSMICKASEDITVSNIGPVFDYMKDGEVIPFTILASSSNEEKLFINFNISNITSNLKEESFKYVLLSSTDKINYNEITSGNFLNINSNDTIELISDYTINKTTYYKLIIYIDGNMENPISMQNGSITGNIEVCTDGVLLVTEEVLEAHKETKTDTVPINKEFSATGAVQNVTLNAGTYKLEVWGAQGGNYNTTYTGGNNTTYIGGKGGYSYGTLTLNNTTNLYVYVGKQAQTITTNGTVTTGGFNGGGNGYNGYDGTGITYAQGGGGATDIRIGQDSLYSRVIVAGGGSGARNRTNGYYGGGTSGGAGLSEYAGSQTSAGTNGSFGTGGSTTVSGFKYRYGSAGGGGGWYGGGATSTTNNSDNINYVTYSGGGSGYVYTSSTATNYPSGNLLTSTYYLTNAATLAGNTSFTSTSGGTETGHSGDGYAKITGNEIGTITYYTIPNLTGLTDLKVSLGTSVSLTEGTTLICENNTTTGCSIASISITDTSTLTEGTHVVTYTVKGANNKKYLFNRKIRVVIGPAIQILTKLGLTENTDIPNFSKTSCLSGCDESTVGIYKTEDNLEESYYFRGDVSNNYVYFAGFYWRIIRINGDGTIRMIYDGTSAHNNGESSTNRYISTSAFNSSDSDTAYIGYMYGTVGASDYATTHANINNSTIKTVLDNWYKSNIEGTTNEQYVVDAIYCNDREIGNSSRYYKAYNRLISSKDPSLKCGQVNDMFAKNMKINNIEVNGALTYPIGLITADEVAYAGGVYAQTNASYYLYIGNSFWTMSPSYDENMFRVITTGDLENRVSEVSSKFAVRPVISISGTALNSGTGTKTDPFKIS